ncbi:MAG: glycosyltransferase family 2 protein [Bacteroidetes bacterium]|nr:glycosyltransferase family 2 protein [Bacteroidota bacterium]
MKEVAVVILNYNGEKFLKDFLGNVVRNSQEADIYVIDNASVDGSLAFVSDNFSDVKIIRLKENLGFAGGYNEGLKEIPNPYFLLLNSDVEVTPNWLTPLISRIKSGQNIVAVQPKILDFRQKDRFEYAGAAGGFLDVFGYAFCRGRVFDSLEADHGQYDDARQIFWATGACFLIKAAVFKDFGGFDARFFAHMEEIDLCWRINNAGLQVYYEPKSTVYHVGGGTLHKSNPFKTFLNYRNNLAMMFKNLPGKYLIPIIFIRMILDGISALKFLKEGSFRDIWAIIRAHFAFYSWIPYLIKNRSSTFYGFPFLLKKSVVFEYFGKSKKNYQEIC